MQNSYEKGNELALISIFLPSWNVLTLQMLRGLAPIVSEDKRAHHLILQSLNSSYEPEFRSAARAMAGFTAISS